MFNYNNNKDNDFENINNYYQQNSLKYPDYQNNNESDSQTISDYDNEYSEDANLYKNKKNISENEENENENEENQNENQNNQNNQNEIKNEIQEGEEEEIEEEEENEEITDENVKQLMNMDMNDKENVLNFLMRDEILTKENISPEEIIKEKNKNKYNYIESKVTQDLESNKNNFYAKQNYNLNKKEGDPQLIKDMSTAAILLKDQIQEENLQVAKLLFDDLNFNNSNKVITGNQIGEKVKKNLEKKKKNLEKIEAKLQEEQKNENTFTPMINRRKGDEIKRNFNKFLKDQENYYKKVTAKKKELIKQTEKEKIPIGKPQLNKTSEEIVKKLTINDEPVYMRLYKKRTKEKSKIEEERLNQEKEKEKEEIMKQKVLKKNPYSYVKSKINIGFKTRGTSSSRNNLNEKNINKYMGSSDKICVPKSRKAKSLDKNQNNNLHYIKNKKLMDYKDLASNKIMYNNFDKKFNEVIQNMKNNNPEISLEEFDEINYKKLLYNLGMTTYPIEVKKNNENQEFNPEIVVENSLKQNEEKLTNDLFNLIKNEQNKIKLSDLKTILHIILGNQNYDLYKIYKNNHEQELKNIFPSKNYKKEQIPDLMIKNQNQEFTSKIDINNPKNNKYISYTSDNQIIINLEKGNNIKKDFNILGLNFRNNRKPSKDSENLLLTEFKNKYPFKPKINEKSEKLSQKVKEKSISMQQQNDISNSQLHNSHTEYIDRILLLDKKRIAENQKIKEELEKKEIKECTFRPKINNDYIFQKEENKIYNSNTNSKIDLLKNSERNTQKEKKITLSSRIEKLYQQGKENIRNKKDRSKEEIEEELQKKECTFQPNTIPVDMQSIPNTKFNNDIYNEKEYQDLYERLKRGRLERMIKNSNNDRYGLNPELQQYVKDNKEYLGNMYYEEGYGDYEEMENDNENSQNENNNNSDKENDENDDENFDPDKKDGIPLLIIDVNIRQGVKKKIYVYEGDTPEMLAEKFAKEQNLEPETQIKLQNLIHNHMIKLLTRIDEENQSVSEKSQNAHNYQKLP